MKESLTEYITRLDEEHKLYQFYKSTSWLKLRHEVLNDAHYECQMCKAKGKINRATQVHHINYVRTHPELALSRTYFQNGIEKQNLIALCGDCHNQVHNRFGNSKKKNQKPLTQEKW